MESKLEGTEPILVTVDTANAVKNAALTAAVTLVVLNVVPAVATAVTKKVKEHRAKKNQTLTVVQ